MKEINLLRYLQSFKKIYFVSPHFDDAVLSAGSLIYELSKKSKVNIITIFTKSEKPPETLSAKKFTRISGYYNSKKLFDDRKIEDKKAMKFLGVNYIHLSFVDALWRKKFKPNRFTKFVPEIYHIYPNFKFNAASGYISRYDKPLILNIEKKLDKIIKKDALVFLPLAVGRHVDHLITRTVCEKLALKNMIYWSDYPYSIYETKANLVKLGYEEFVFKKNITYKMKAIMCYKSQTKALFSNGHIPSLPDVFYVPPNFMLK